MRKPEINYQRLQLLSEKKKFRLANFSFLLKIEKIKQLYYEFIISEFFISFNLQQRLSPIFFNKLFFSLWLGLSNVWQRAVLLVKRMKKYKFYLFRLNKAMRLRMKPIRRMRRTISCRRFLFNHFNSQILKKYLGFLKELRKIKQKIIYRVLLGY